MNQFKTKTLAGVVLALASSAVLAMSPKYDAPKTPEAPKAEVSAPAKAAQPNTTVPAGLTAQTSDYSGCTSWDGPVNILEKLANEGNVMAQYSLGALYLQGSDTVKANEKLGVEWLKKAAAQNFACANMDLATHVESRSATEAFAYYKKAADLGLRQAQFFTASAYEGGNGVEKNPKLAYEYYLKAAQQNHDWAQYTLATMLEKGIGTQKDPKAAIEWYTKSANNGRFDAQLRLGEIYFDGINTEKDYAKALHYFKDLAEDGYVVAQVDLAQMYLNGWGVKVDVKKAIKLLTLASNHNSDDANILLGDLYAQGKQVPKDLKKARHYYNLSCKEKVALACERIKALK